MYLPLFKIRFLGYLVSMKERELCSLFKKTCAEDGLMYVDIPDSMGNVSTPCDGILNYYGKFVAIEAKRFTKYKAFHPNELRENQVRGLEAAVESGGKSIVILFIWESRVRNIMLWWEWEDFKTQTKNLTESIKINVLKEHPFTTCVKKRYNLKPFYNDLDILLL